MHHALEIEEILSKIFHHCSTSHPCREGAPDLVALARTCRAFKEPALDILWRALDNFSPLVQCLPEASHQLSQKYKYSFKRPLTQTEWDILQSYTRRIRSMTNFDDRLDWESVRTFLNPPTSGPLFPNLRYLHCRFTEKTMPLLHPPLPSLLYLFASFEDPYPFLDSLESFPESSPNLRELSVYLGRSDVAFSKFVSNWITRWQNLQIVACPRITLDTDALMHLSRIPALTRLDFVLSTTLPDSDSPLVFSNLHNITSRSKFLGPTSRLLIQTRLPAVIYVSAVIETRPSRQDLTSFLAGVPTSNSGHTIETLQLQQIHNYADDVRREEALLLDFEDLMPCMAFRNLRHIEVDMECNVGLTDSEVLTLASAWPKLEHLLINEGWAWNLRGGITPGGLVQLLQTCRSLSRIALRLDTRGYIEVPPSQVPASLGLTFPALVSINVLDSAIEAESVTAIATFFSGIADYSKPEFSISYRGDTPILDLPTVEEYTARWFQVFALLGLIDDNFGQCFEDD